MQNSSVKLEVDATPARIALCPFALQWELIDAINENDA